MRAGKSTVAKYLADKLSIPIVSFGAYLMHYAESKDLPPTRDVLQEIGNALVSENVDNFVDKVFKYANLRLPIAIVEGIRHKSVRSALKNITEDLLLIFIDVDQQIRYQRYCSGQKTSDSQITFQEFLEKDYHSVEAEIESLKQDCQIISGSDHSSNKYILDQLILLKPSLSKKLDEPWRLE